MEDFYVMSKSHEKLSAALLACYNLNLNVNIISDQAESDEDEQPEGFEATVRGALTRAKTGKKRHPKNVIIAIENGIFRFMADTKITLDIGIVVILTPRGKRIISTSPAIQFPEECVLIAEEEGFDTTTVGSIIARTLGGKSTDPHATMTEGRVTRTHTLTSALEIALRQLRT